MQARADLDPELTDDVTDRFRAANRTGWSVKRRQEAVAGVLDSPATSAIEWVRTSRS
jgi:hypothetical protein